MQFDCIDSIASVLPEINKVELIYELELPVSHICPQCGPMFFYEK